MNILKRQSFSILFNVFMTIFIQSVLFLMNLEVSIVSVILAAVLYLIYSYYFIDYKSFTKKSFLSLFIYFLIIISLFCYFSMFVETTYDGGYYHGNAMVEMLNGWNPFLEANNYQETKVTIWADYYPKASWIFSAVYIKMFKHLSAGMIMNTLINISLLLYAYDFIVKRSKNHKLATIVCICLFFNPIVIEQMHTYYIDGLLGNLSILLLLVGCDIIEEYDINNNILVLIISVILINLKFTGFGFAGIINLFIWFALLYKKDYKSFKVYTLFGVLMLFISIFIIGYSPYFINISNLRHIFYPIAGKDKQDVVTYLIPEVLVNTNPIHKLIYSMTSGQGIINSLIDLSPQTYLVYDERIGAFGNMFSKIVLICTFIYSAYVVKYAKKLDMRYVLLFIGLLASIIANYQNIWWFRYAPQIWLLVVIAIYMCYLNSKTKIIAHILLILIMYQGIFILYHTVDNDYAKSQSVLVNYEILSNKSFDAAIVNNDMSDVYWFDAFEMYRAKQYGVTLNSISHDLNLDSSAQCYFMHSYKLCEIE